MDNGVQFEQSVAALPIAVVILQAPSNDIDDLLPLVPAVLSRLNSIKPRTIERVP
jgi:hypothetical protein